MTLPVRVSIGLVVAMVVGGLLGGCTTGSGATASPASSATGGPVSGAAADTGSPTGSPVSSATASPSSPASGPAGSPASGGSSGSTPAGVPAVITGPTISGTPVTTVAAGSTYTFSPTGASAGSTAWTFVISNRPAWATFDAATGTLSGRPTTANVGSYGQIVISVTDGAKLASLAPFAISVTAPVQSAHNLSITGAPATSVSLGSAYDFTPSAADTAGAKLTFSITNRPVWATFDSATGRLSGTPVTANVGTTSLIQISVGDGTATASLMAFSIAVKSGVASSNSLKLSWTAPTLDANGQPMTDLAGYRVYYGTSAKNLNTVVNVDKATVTDQIISNLQAGTWYFAVTSYNTAKIESDLSAILPVTI
jgi:hypothetical protein